MDLNRRWIDTSGRSCGAFRQVNFIVVKYNINLAHPQSVLSSGLLSNQKIPDLPETCIGGDVIKVNWPLT